MDLSAYFTPSEVHFDDYRSHQLGHSIKVRDFELTEIDIALLSVEEERGDLQNVGCSTSHEEIKKYFYQLSKAHFNPRIADLGTIKQGASLSDTYFAVQDSVSYLIKNDVLPIIIGGSQDIAFANYLAYTKLEQVVNVVSIDSRFAFGNSDEIINANNYLSKILFHQPNVLFNYSHLGYQSYLVDHKEFELIDELFFDTHRLGLIKSDIASSEPIIRNADMIAFSASSIAQSDAPANVRTSPNGFSGEQACQLARYAGISDKLSSVGFYDVNTSIDDKGQTAHLFAQMIWYFIEGFYSRKGDFPKCNKQEYLKYTVTLNEGDQELTFYKSPKTDRWWMDVPYYHQMKTKYQRHLMLPCTYEDYKSACENEMPERWFKTFQKLK